MILVVLAVIGTVMTFNGGADNSASKSDDTPLTPNANALPASQPRADAIVPALTTPPYRVLFKQRMIAPPGVLVEVVVPSLSKSTPQAQVASVALAILKREGGDRMNIYATEAAFRANEDSDYGDKHPGALEHGFLGRVENGTFVPPPAWMR